MNCANLSHITLPKEIKSIKARVFMFCSNLTHFTISESIRYIGPDAFYGCNRLQYILISGSNEKELARIRNLLPDELKGKLVSKCQDSIHKWQFNTKEALWNAP